MSIAADTIAGDAPPPRVPLDTDRILDAAAELIAAEGNAAFSMRRLATRLGVTPMALYKWFDNRESLLQALGARVFDTLALPDDRGGDWNQRMLDVAVALRSGFARSGAILPLVADHTRIDMLMARTADRILSLLAEIGCTGPDAVERFRAFFWTVVGYSFSVDSSRATATERVNDHLTGAVAALGPESVPALTAALPDFTPMDPDALFEFTMRTLIVGIADAHRIT